MLEMVSDLLRCWCVSHHVDERQSLDAAKQLSTRLPIVQPSTCSFFCPRHPAMYRWRVTISIAKYHLNRFGRANSPSLVVQYVDVSVLRGRIGVGAFGTRIGVGAFGTRIGVGAFGTRIGIGAFGTCIGVGAFGTRIGIETFGGSLGRRDNGSIVLVEVTDRLEASEGETMGTELSKSPMTGWKRRKERQRERNYRGGRP